jgi:hypothetical protein
MQDSLAECVQVQVRFEDEKPIEAITSRSQLGERLPIVRYLGSGKRVCVPREIIREHVA